MSLVIRSLLFVPGNRPERFEKAINSGADMICIDLEDAVGLSEKDSARDSTLGFAASNPTPLCVRINPLQNALGQEDLAAIVAMGKQAPAYVMLAKCQSPQQVYEAALALDGCPTKLIGLIETPAALEQAAAIAAASKRLCALMFGGADMAAELGCEFSYEPLLLARSQLVMAAARARVPAIDVPFIDIKDEAGLGAETLRVKALGFSAKAAIHPKQIAAIHQAFCPTPEQIEWAEQVMAAAAQANGGVVQVAGRMVDAPIIRACERTLALAALSSKTNN